MTSKFWILGFALCCVGCATTGSQLPSATFPEDLGGWTSPAVPPPLEPPPAPIVRRPPGAGELVLPYEPGEVTKVKIAVGEPLTFQFAVDDGQVLTIVGGDRSVLPLDDPENPWLAKIGAPGSALPLAHVTVSKPGVSTGLTFVTQKRLYLVRLTSVARSNTRVVRWEIDEPPVVAKAPPRRLPDASTSATYNVGYRLEPSRPDLAWLPRQIIDDGRKAYILLPRNLPVMEAPMLRLIGPSGPELVNTDLVESVIVLPHLFQVAELRLGTGATAETVRLVRDTPQLIRCPGAAGCPVWPEASLARR